MNSSDVQADEGRILGYTANLPAKRMAAAVLFFDDHDHLLLVQPSYKPDWELPGGSVNANESPRAAAIREIEEELGLTVTPGRLLAIDWVPPNNGRTEGLMSVFDGGTLSSEQITAIRIPPDELLSWAWSTPADESERLSPLLARRTQACRQARAGGSTAYLENGYPAA